MLFFAPGNRFGGAHVGERNQVVAGHSRRRRGGGVFSRRAGWKQYLAPAAFVPLPGGLVGHEAVVFVEVQAHFV